MRKTLWLTMLLTLCLCSGALAAAPAEAEGPAGANSENILNRFLPGMKRADVQEGATFTKGPEGALISKIQWGKADWSVLVQFKGDTVDNVALHTTLNDRVLKAVLGAIQDENMLPLSVSRAGKETMLFHLMSKQNKSPDDCTEALQKELDKFAGQKSGQMLITLTTEDAYYTFVDVDKGVKGANLSTVGTDELVAVQLDKKDKTLVIIISTIAKFSE